MNTDAERYACKIRLRAERKAGEMLKESARNGERATRVGNLRAGPKSTHATSAPTLSDLGISKYPASRSQKLTEVPNEDSEAAREDPVAKPSTTGIVRKANGKTDKMHPDCPSVSR